VKILLILLGLLVLGLVVGLAAVILLGIVCCSEAQDACRDDLVDASSPAYSRSPNKL